MLGRPNQVAQGYGILPSSLRIWPLSAMVIWISNTCWKTSALLTVLSGQQVSTIHKFKLSNLQLTDTIALFNITEPQSSQHQVENPNQLSSIDIPTMNNYALFGLFRRTW